MNWNKIFANSGIAFFATMSGTTIAGSPDLFAASISALILAGLAFFTEMKTEAGGTTENVQKIVNSGLII